MIATIHELNRRFLKHDEPTDVISFVLDQADGIVDGQIVVSADTAAASAKRFGWTAADELLLYAIHGTLHLVGYDDRTARAQQAMRRRERRYLGQFGLSPQYRQVSPTSEKSPAMTSMTLLWISLVALAMASFAAIGVHVLREFSRTQVREIFRERNQLPRYEEIMSQHQPGGLGRGKPARGRQRRRRHRRHRCSLDVDGGGFGLGSLLGAGGHVRGRRHHVVLAGDHLDSDVRRPNLGRRHFGAHVAVLANHRQAGDSFGARRAGGGANHLPRIPARRPNRLPRKNSKRKFAKW